jgi:homoserine kinase
MPNPNPIRLRLPATSANLGPGFDALGLAMGLYLTIDARPAPAFSIDASGRDALLCARLDDNLLLTTYTGILNGAGVDPIPLHLDLVNGIPLGMGCGSSAAALLAGTFLANHFGRLAWSPQQILDEACRREGHPDNVAACFHGAFTASLTVASQVGEPATTLAATFGEHLPWRLLLAIPTQSLATAKARALLPETYTRSAAVENVQATALLVSAFALGRPDLLRHAMRDNLHQPFRGEVCPLLPLLLPLANQSGIFGVALSGAGPSVIVIADPTVPLGMLLNAIQAAAGARLLEVLETSISAGATLIETPVIG